MPFVETLAHVAMAPLPAFDVEDELAREAAMQEQALHAALAAKRTLTKAGVPFWRPQDYFAEMIKSDDHMLKVSLFASFRRFLTLV